MKITQAEWESAIAAQAAAKPQRREAHREVADRAARYWIERRDGCTVVWLSGFRGDRNDPRDFTRRFPLGSH